MGQVIKSPEAEVDLIDIWDYIGQNNEVAADRVLNEIDRKLKLLSNSPYIGRERIDLGNNLRSFPVGN
ncbi:type II toxin-antitoxin system RelE/ParE family toxin [Scytonema sp. NUACC26]|uniref:type II toxin-antitoxin system RelE/ParE family toxin n=1 Tax=Scytonema sp. NUACC26 TaxID=3140176 RepID=UPI0034DC45F5